SPGVPRNLSWQPVPRRATPSGPEPWHAGGGRDGRPEPRQVAVQEAVQPVVAQHVADEMARLRVWNGIRALVGMPPAALDPPAHRALAAVVRRQGGHRIVLEAPQQVGEVPATEAQVDRRVEQLLTGIVPEPDL